MQSSQIKENYKSHLLQHENTVTFLITKVAFSQYYQLRKSCDTLTSKHFYNLYFFFEFSKPHLILTDMILYGYFEYQFLAIVIFVALSPYYQFRKSRDLLTSKHFFTSFFFFFYEFSKTHLILRGMIVSRNFEYYYLGIVIFVFVSQNSVT